MKSAELLRCCFWMLLVAAAPAAWAQDGATTPVATPANATVGAGVAGAGAVGAIASPAATPVGVAGASAAAPAMAAPAVAKTGSAAGAKLRTTAVQFSREKPVLGLPLGSSTTRAHCSSDGTAFYDMSSGGATAGQELYSISTDGGVKHVLRKLPVDYNHVQVSDFYVGDQQLVTLLEADKRNDGSDASTPREVNYFLSVSDHDGDLSKLVQVDVRFRPLKIASFGSGDVMVLGWDEGNLLPEIALLKDDGTVRRFIDFDQRRPDAAREQQASDAQREAAQERVTLEELQGVAFVPYGNEIMLTYPGTTKPIRVLSGMGESRIIPIALPGGYVLHDVLVSTGRGTLVVRAQEAKSQDKTATDDATQAPKMRLFEVSSYTGATLSEFTFAKPQVSEVTCAPSNSLVAVFLDTLPDAVQTATSSGATGTAANTATQLVVATSRR